jgi:5-oxoprolinase (ATP-hydrolysing) subunit A
VFLDKPSAGPRIDLNADLGEWAGGSVPAAERALMPHITSANIACGFHAGDPFSMRTMVVLAREHGVAVGAHPSFPDRQGFGRQEMQLAPHEVESLVLYQIGALAAIAAAEGATLHHVKPHGALFNMAARDAGLADAVARATATVDSSLVLFGLAGSELVAAGRRVGLRTANEVFADRAYRADGSLMPRGERGAIIDDAKTVVGRVLAMAREGSVISSDGHVLRVEADTICIHSDTAGAAELAQLVKQALIDAGVAVKPVGK